MNIEVGNSSKFVGLSETKHEPFSKLTSKTSIFQTIHDTMRNVGFLFLAFFCGRNQEILLNVNFALMKAASSRWLFAQLGAWTRAHSGIRDGGGGGGWDSNQFTYTSLTQKALCGAQSNKFEAFCCATTLTELATAGGRSDALITNDVSKPQTLPPKEDYARWGAHTHIGRRWDSEYVMRLSCRSADALADNQSN